MIKNSDQTLIDRSEAALEAQLDKVAKEWICDREAGMLLLSGPSCSGKTTVANKLCQRLAQQGIGVKAISVDDFYRDRGELLSEAEGGLPDFEAFGSLDRELLRNCLKRLWQGEVALLPRFDFQSGRRSGYEVYGLPKQTRVLVEGIQTVYPAFRALLEELQIPYRGIYVCPCQPVHCGETVFSPEELRFLRRVVRDLRTRNADPAYTLALWEQVRRNEDAQMTPFAGQFDWQIDTALAYEPYVIKAAYLAGMEAAGEGKTGGLLEMIAEKLEKIPAMDTDGIPKGSVFREFIGD